ncbi:hypothetical protein [Streptomyces sp. NPDC047841]
MNDPEKNKTTAKAFYDLVFNERRPAEALDERASPQLLNGSHLVTS